MSPPHPRQEEKTEEFHPCSQNQALSPLQWEPQPGQVLGQVLPSQRQWRSPSPGAGAWDVAGAQEVHGSELRTYLPTLYPDPQ